MRDLVSVKAKKPSPARVRELFYYDEGTGVLFWHPRTDVGPQWNAKHAHKPAGSAHPKGIYVRLQGKSYAAHQLIWVLMTDAWPTSPIDHKDTDPYNNRWDNLRLATVAENNKNVSKVRGKVPYKGVYLWKPSGLYRAQIGLHGRRIYLGQFGTAEKAARAYDAAALELHGEFASTNASLGLLNSSRGGGQDA